MRMRADLLAWCDRFFAEECDALGGFQFVAHDAGGFGALTEGLLTHLRDDYARTPVVRALCALGVLYLGLTA